MSAEPRDDAPGSGIAGDRGLEAAAAFGVALDALRAALPPDDARALELGAVPHWLDEPLLGRLLDAPADAAPRLAALLALRFVHRDEDGRVRYHEAARAHLGERMRAEAPDRWRAAHARAMAHFDALALADGDGRTDHWYEALYHRLVADEAAGLRELDERFDRAAWEHRLGLAERVVEVAREAQPDLGEAGRWRLRLLEAELDRHLGRGDGGAAELARLAGQAPDGRVRAAASVGLGEAALAASRWRDALGHLAAGRDALGAAPAGPDDGARARLAARAARGLGDVYLDLAARGGGMASEPGDPPAGRAARLLDRLARLPFAAYAWLARRVAAVPAWWALFPDAGYPDWIVAELLRIAQRRYDDATRALGERDPRSAAALRTAIARLDRQRHRARRATDALDRLVALPEVADSPYWRAQLDLERARAAALLRRDGADAAAVAAARDALRRFHDEAGAGAASRLLAEGAEARGRVDEAAGHWLDAHASSAASGDLLARTLVAGRLERLAGGASPAGAPSEPWRARLGAALAAEDRQAFLARFPDRMLERFRRIALVLAMPPAVALGVVATLALIPLVLVVEGESIRLATGTAAGTTARDYALLIAFALLPAPLAVWSFRALFGLLGERAVRRIGRDVSALERAAPAVFVTGPEGLERFAGDRAQALPWAEMARRVDVEVRILDRPVALLARTILEDPGGESVVVDGIASGFDRLRAEIGRRLGTLRPAPPTEVVRVDLLAPRWVLGVAAVAGAVALAATASGQVFMGVSETLDAATAQPAAAPDLPISGFVFGFLPTALFLFLAATHARLLAFDRAARRAVSTLGALLPRRLLVAATVLWVAVAALWLALLGAMMLA